jgi:hypothetical protein
MPTKPTMSQVVGLMSIIIIPLIIWGVSVETRFTANIYRIEQNEERNDKIDGQINRIEENTLNTLLEIERLKK